MRGSRNLVVLRRWLGLSGTVCALIVFGVSISAAQFGIPKIKVPKIGKSSPVNKVVQGPVPEVTAINPNSVPPGWEGNVVLTGHNFSKSMKLRVSCPGFAVDLKEFKVEGPERAVQSLSIPPGAQDERCEVAVEFRPGGPSDAEIEPSQGGTLEVVQVKSASFAVSSSSTLAVARRACLMGEGKIEGYEAYLNAQIEFQKKFLADHDLLDKCQMLVSSDSVKYMQGEKTVFERPASAVKKVEKVVIDTPVGDMPSDVFSITWTDGKIQNFTGMSKNGAPASQAYDDLKEKLKK